MTLTFESEVEVEYNPDTLDLKPGDVRAVYIMVRNLGDRILYFKVEVVGVDASGSSSIDVFNHMFILEPGCVDQVVVTIESRAHFQQDPDVSNVKITLRWGPNATTIVGGAFRLEDPEFRNSIEYEIEDDFSGQWVWILGIIVIAVGVVTLIVIVKRWRARRKVEEPSVEPYGEGSKGGTDAMTVRHTFTPRITREDGDTRDQVTSDRRVD